MSYLVHMIPTYLSSVGTHPSLIDGLQGGTAPHGVVHVHLSLPPARRAAEPEEALLVTPVQLSIRRTALVAPHVRLHKLLAAANVALLADYGCEDQAS